MDSFGELLKTTRESKNLDLERISREISIEQKYLQGLEDEDNSVFPGEAYMTGFLRNYSIYLDLDAEYMLKLYRNKKIQESPVPEGLIVHEKPRWLVPAIIIPCVVVVLVVAGVLLGILLKNKRNAQIEEDVSTVNANLKQYELGDTKFFQRVYKGTQFIIPTEKGTKIILTVKDVLGSFGLDTPAGLFYTDLSEENELDIDGDNITDMIVYVSDISNTDESRGAEVSILLRHGMAAVAAVDTDDIPFASEIKSKHPQKVILEDNRAYPFTITATFRDPCLFRDKSDNGDSVETYYTRGEVFTANPHNGIRLWISNGSTVSFNIIADSKSYNLEIGGAGKVIVEDIKWIKDSDGRYKLVVIELD